MKYRVAEYYPQFACKCGECRASCCSGWPVTIRKDEYDRIMEAPASPEYREELKAALRLNFAPEDARYAHIVHGKSGHCLLQREDGLCGLQLALGEAVLPDVCRLYPRNRRLVGGGAECALSMSCEGVVELLLSSREPLRLIETELGEEPLFSIDMTEEQKTRCRRALELISDRTMTIPERFSRMGEELFDCVSVCGETEGRLEGVRMLHKLTQDQNGKNKVAGVLCSHALACFGLERKDKLSQVEAEELLRRYDEAGAAVWGRWPDWTAFADRLLANHMFYNSFPHVGGTSDGARAFEGLCAVYAFVKFVTVGNLLHREGREPLADVLGELGRMIEHSDFKYRAAQAYRRQSEYAPGYWRQLTGL